GGEAAASLAACVLEAGVLAVLPAVVVRESVDVETGDRRHPELGASRGESRRLVEVELLVVAGNGVLDPRKGNLVDRADLRLRVDAGKLDLEGRKDRVE